MSTMLDQDTELFLFLENAEPPKCEVRHLDNPEECNVVASYIAVLACDGATVLWCRKRYEVFIERAEGNCRRCRKPVLECWSVRPI